MRIPLAFDRRAAIDGEQKMYRNFGMTILTSLALVLVSGCNENDCPVGQVLYEGECVDVIGQDPECGPGTYSDEGVCRPHEDICGPNTEVVWVLDDNGLATEEFYCEGQRITAVPACPESPDGALICVSGWAKYLMDPTHPCNLMETLITFDSTELEVAVFDPLAYAINPNTQPLGVTEVDPFTGTWKVENIAVPATKFIAVVVRSIDPLTEFIFTGYPYPASNGQNIEEISAYGITADQNTAWSAAIGDTAIAGANNCTSGDSLFDCGTWIGVFGYEKDDGSISFLEGIVPRNGVPDPILMPEIPITNTFYLDDTCEGFVQPSTLAESYTGSLGMVFMPGAQLSNFNGTCADLDPDSECEAESYEFDSRLGGAAPQAIFVQLEYPAGLE
jgi:hypothetical protein